MNLRKSIGISIWAACCIGLGLLLAYIDGVGVDGLIFSALLMSSVVFTALAGMWVYQLLKRRFRPNNQDQHRDIESTPSTATDSDELEVNASVAANITLGGGALGALIGWLLFQETSNIIGCSLIGMVLGQLFIRWRSRRQAKHPTDKPEP